MPMIWFIRHAQSQANAGEKTINPASIALTPIGHRQAIHIAEVFKQAPDLVISSPYLRAQQTAESLLQRYPDAKHEIWPVHEFTYLALERCRDTTVQERLPMAEEFWQRNDPDYKDGDGAESFADFMGRAAATWQRLQSEKSFRDVVIFTHAQFIKAAIWHGLHAGEHLTAKGMRRFRHFLYSFPIPNGAIVRTRLDPAFWTGVVDTSHIPVPLRTE
jgi:broad specificity phosphatase PhoE